MGSQCVRSGPETKNNKKKTKKKRKYSDQQRKVMDFDEPHLTPNEKTQPIQWTEQPTGAKWCIGGRWRKGLTLVPGINIFRRQVQTLIPGFKT